MTLVAFYVHAESPYTNSIVALTSDCLHTPRWELG
jgi:hypothetical protein